LKNILIYGSGLASKKLKEEILKIGINIKGIIVDKKRKKYFGNIPFYKLTDLNKITKKDKIDTIIFAIPSIQNKKKIQILNKLKINNIDLLNLNDDVVLKNHVGLKDINDIKPEYFLKKKLINNSKIKKNFKNEIILITGGCGSIGRSLTEKIIKLRPKEIIINDISEYGIHNLNIKINLIKKKYNIKTKIRFIMGNLSNRIFVKNCLKKINITYIFHCAAYKHVDIVEDNILEAYNNNINSTRNLLSLFEDSKSLKSFLLISTDKAYKSKNVMGATKRVCEKMVMLNNLKSKINKYKVVRFGNVFASDGSAIPKIFNQILNNEKVTITSPKMKRYFLTMNEACELIIAVSTFNKRNGDIMFFKMGKSIKIINIAKKIAKYFNKDFNYKIIGIRKGEKLNEILHHKSKKIKTLNPNIYGITDNVEFSNKKMILLLEKMEIFYNLGNALKLRKILLNFSNL